jgi:hypothetical protein
MPKRSERAPDQKAQELIKGYRAALENHLETLLPGGDIDNTAEWIGIGRSTLYRWKEGDRAMEAGPPLFVIAALAAYRGLTITDILSEKALPVERTPYETQPKMKALVDALIAVADEHRDEIIRHALWSAERAPKVDDNILHFVPHSEKSKPPRKFPPLDFTVTEKDFKQRDFDFPQPWHYWTNDVPIDDLPAAAAGPRGAANLLNRNGGKVREVFDEINRIVKVDGDSMEEEFFDGDLVRIDTGNRKPLKGEPIAVYCEDLGGSLLGYYKPDGDRVILVKQNKPKHDDVLLPPMGWVLLGPVAEVVSRRVRRARV